MIISFHTINTLGNLHMLNIVVPSHILTLRASHSCYFSGSLPLLDFNLYECSMGFSRGGKSNRQQYRVSKGLERENYSGQVTDRPKARLVLV